MKDTDESPNIMAALDTVVRYKHTYTFIVILSKYTYLTGYIEKKHFRETETTNYSALKLERYSLKVAIAYESMCHGKYIIGNTSKYT